MMQHQLVGKYFPFCGYYKRCVRAVRAKRSATYWIIFEDGTKTIYGWGFDFNRKCKNEEDINV